MDSDPLTADFPQRLQLDEEQEAQAQLEPGRCIPLVLVSPADSLWTQRGLRWPGTPCLNSVCSGPQERLQVSLMVVCTSNSWYVAQHMSTQCGYQAMHIFAYLSCYTMRSGDRMQQRLVVPAQTCSMQAGGKSYNAGLQTEVCDAECSAAWILRVAGIADNAVHVMQIVGCITLADHSLAGACLQPNLKDSTCLIVKVRGQSSWLLLCQYSVAENQAVLWAEVLYSAIRPKQTMILAGQVRYLLLDLNRDCMPVAECFMQVTQAVCSARLACNSLPGLCLHSQLSSLSNGTV